MITIHHHLHWSSQEHDECSKNVNGGYRNFSGFRSNSDDQKSSETQNFIYHFDSKHTNKRNHNLGFSRKSTELKFRPNPFRKFKKKTNSFHKSLLNYHTRYLHTPSIITNINQALEHHYNHSNSKSILTYKWVFTKIVFSNQIKHINTLNCTTNHDKHKSSIKNIITLLKIKNRI